MRIDTDTSHPATDVGRIPSEPWGTLPGGDPVRRYTLRNAHGVRVVVSDLGATVVSWLAPDRTGRFADIVLAHDTPAEYLDAGAYLGATIGRWANRIAAGRFTLDGIDYPLDRNENGNLLHGGASGFHRARWDVIDDRGGLTLRLESPEGDAGFPGNVRVQVRYTLDDDGTLTIDYTGVTDAPTPLNLTNHSYFNLSGRAGGDVRGHLLQIDADAFVEVDDALIPTGTADVTGSAFDFRQSAPIGARLDWPHAQLARGRGFDHCYVLREPGGGVRTVASIYDPESGRELAVSTDQRGLQLYTGNYLQGLRVSGGVVCAPHAALCVEAGYFPDQVNMDALREETILRPGQVYRQTTRYRVGVRG
ncbi:TPA: galactose mutarotase [Burkholderia vietnamiensis]|uniref:Aldose 1-epimerase n=1 Tax=Burkholderia vietnamiensis TaxID=60552 RepID=A0AA45BDD3_BURVI|nr:aldose epimerase family protein [Burkholderia vietnamiensis]KVF07581.1 galactose mutarotase [Burkholderia vietnamiensis]KVS08256.1 galactose mutarotase [Burkholderia vietnamiensis]MBR8192122.1 galactose mutarotase [Burkholderia vietnamiensis]MCA8209062.1 galactose mutarotase [Burkholderia vietnamiensis]PRH42525.1 galactose-1-epimerase [Burkholderia vietnamiensis]